jgi:hypothetical protein
MLYAMVPTVLLQLSIEVQSEPITGSLTGAPGETPRSFSGWVELASAIEAARCHGVNGADAEKLGLTPGANGGTP